MKIIRCTSLVMMAVWTISLNAYADVPAWDIDKIHSGAFFRIKHIYSTVSGHFNDFDGQIHFDPDDLEGSRMQFTVAVESIDTNQTKRDNHLLSGDFFDADKYPQMTFESTAIEHVDRNQYAVDGTLTIKDVSRSIRVPFIYFGRKKNPLSPKQEVVGFEANLFIDRFDYNVGNGKYLELGVVGKDVDILVTIEAMR